MERKYNREEMQCELQRTNRACVSVSVCVSVCVYEEEEKRQSVSIIGIFQAVLEANVLDPHCSVDRGRKTLQNTSVCY